MNIRYRVELSEAERGELQAMLRGGTQAARKLKRAQILLAADAGVADEAMATSLAVSGSTVYRTKRRFVEGNLDGALTEEPRPGAARKLSGKEEALLVATACASPPEGRARWTLELLTDELVRLTPHESLSRETVRRRLAENELKPWRQKMWCVPQINGEYVARMEDVLDLYAQAPDPKRPVVCLDESPIQLIGEVRQPIPAAPGVEIDFAHAETIRVVMDNLSTHTPGSLYEAFAAAEAHRILRRLEFHFTPKHASWLNMAEIEIGVLRGQCLDRRIDTRERLEREIAAWERQRNAAGARVTWRFTTETARAKMGRAYPKPKATLDRPAKPS